MSCVRFYVGSFLVAAYRVERSKLRFFGDQYGMPRKRRERLDVYRARMVHYLRNPFSVPTHRCAACDMDVAVVVTTGGIVACSHCAVAGRSKPLETFSCP